MKNKPDKPKSKIDKNKKTKNKPKIGPIEKTEEEINEALKLYPEEASSLISQIGLNALEYYDVIN